MIILKFLKMFKMLIICFAIKIPIKASKIPCITHYYIFKSVYYHFKNNKVKLIIVNIKLSMFKLQDRNNTHLMIT